MILAAFLTGYMFGKKDIVCKTTFNGDFYQPNDANPKNQIHIEVKQGERGYLLGPFQMCGEFKIIVDRIENFKNHANDYKKDFMNMFKETK